MNGNLFARLAEGFPTDRGRVFLETAAGESLSFADLLDRAGRMAMLLQAAGVGPGDRVAVQVEKSPEAIALYLACLQAGAVYVPLNSGYTPAELGYFITDAAPRVVICDPDAESALGPIAAGARAALYTLGADGGGRLTAEAAALPSDRAVAARGGADLAAILYTSGTTGRSKGAMLSHDNLWSNVATLHRLWGFRPDDVLIHALPLYHTHGLFVALNLMLMNGGRMILLPKFDAETVHRPDGAGDGADGRSDVLRAAAGQPAADRGGVRADAAVRVGLGAAARGDACGVRGRAPGSGSSSATA